MLTVRSGVQVNVAPIMRYAFAMDRTLAVTGLREYFDAHADGIVCAYLFGSTARGDARPGSDVDVGILLARDPAPTLAESGVRIAEAIERHLHCPVETVLLNRAPVDLVHRVLRDGVLVFDADPARRIQFEVRARSLFFDLKPILDRYRRKAPAARG
jgi:predicted nucleotidyltransferase